MDNMEVDNQLNTVDGSCAVHIERLEDLIENSKNVPFSGDKVSVSKNEVFDIIENLRYALPKEIKQAQRIVGQAHSIIEKANTNGKAIIMEANQKASQMVTEEQIYKQAKAEAEALLDDARNRADAIVKEATDKAINLKVGSVEYADKMLTNTESRIDGLMKSIESNTDHLKSYLNQEIDAIYEERQALSTYYDNVYEEQ